jgi:hypothetical protein
MAEVTSAKASYCGLDMHRDSIRGSLDEIVCDISAALREARLTFPVYIAVTNSGDSLATIATPDDPSEADWMRASAIVCEVVAKRIDHRPLRGRELACAVASAENYGCRGNR